MDEKSFFEALDEKLKYYLEPIMAFIDTQKMIRDVKLADHSKVQTRISSGKKMPTIIGDYTIADKGCNKCGGKITWDNYNKETQPYPDHVDEDGNLCDCPEYTKQ